ncbi:MAG TPA: D-TA family PLP-dependent enzyme, partial [Pirellulales bacterium]
AFRERLAEAGLPVSRIVAAGSPSFPVHARHDEREVSPGTTVFWDHNYGARYPEAGFEPAALVLGRVVSKPAPNRVCLDLGSKALSADTPLPRAHFLNLPPVTAVMQSEEHLVLEFAGADDWPVGSVVYAVPFHICPTVALYDEATIVEYGRSHGTWEIVARRRRLTI